jgi:mannose-6-phosphate isomerase-like protein (cupin superfamily)
LCISPSSSTLEKKAMEKEKEYNYVTRMDIKYNHLEKVDVNRMVRECTDKWFNQTLTKVNDSLVRIGIVEGEYHWHKHDTDDEFFFVLEGKLIIHMEDRVIELNPNEGVTITRGLMHRPVAPVKTVMLMVETSGIVPTGD